MTKFSGQQKVAEAIFQNLGTSPSEMSKGAVLVVPLVSGIAAGVAAPTVTILHKTDGLLSEVNKKGAAGEGSMMERLGRIAGACDSLNFVTVVLLSKFVCAKLGNRSSSGMSLVWSPCVLFLGIRISGLPLFFVVCSKT